MTKDLTDFESLDDFKLHPVSGQIDAVFKTVIKEKKSMEKKQATPPAEPGEISLGEIGEIDIDLSDDGSAPPAAPVDEGMDLSLSDSSSLDLGAPVMIEGDEPTAQYANPNHSTEDATTVNQPRPESESEDQLTVQDMRDLTEETNIIGDLDDMSFDEAVPDLSEGEDLIENLGELDLGGEDAPPLPADDLNLGGTSVRLDVEDAVLGAELSPGDDEMSLDADMFSGISEEDTIQNLNLEKEQNDLSDDAMEKLKEIDAIMDFDASGVSIKTPDLKSELSHASKKVEPDPEPNLDESLVSEDLNLEALDFGDEKTRIEVKVPLALKEEKRKKKEEEIQVSPPPARDRELGTELREISVAYSGEMERMQATISNLRADREELLSKIQKLEEDKLLQSRQGLTMRAELDERKIELTIIRKKLNEEISDLKDRLRLHDEKRLILEEKNRILSQELDKGAQKNKIDLKKVQMRERELEQKLELLKSDAETQIRNRDLKILELKRKIDAMEFDMESISQQEKRSVESRFELEDKLEKAIKTLRTAITVLEDETDRSSALNALKKNIDM